MDNIKNIYNASVFLLNASKSLLEHDRKTADYLLNLSEKYLHELENDNLPDKDKKAINKYKKMLKG